MTEGHQESLLTECNVLEANYDEVIASGQEVIEQEGKKELFAIFPVIARLMSSSVFAELNEEEVVFTAPSRNSSFKEERIIFKLEITLLFFSGRFGVTSATIYKSLTTS